MILGSASSTTESHGAKKKSGLSFYWSNTSKQLFASGVSGCVEVCITYPTDYVKIMLQLDERSGQVKRFRNSFDVLKQTFHQHGVSGVYRGFSVVFYGAIPKYMCRFGSYEQIKRFFVDKTNNGQLKPTDKLICGTLAGLSEAIFAVIPQETIKVKFINDRCSEKPRYKGLIHGIKEIVAEKGLRGAYQGVTPTLIKQSSNQAIRFFVFESLKEWYIGREKEQRQNTKVNDALMTLMFGAIAGSVSVFGNTPFDVIKTRMQGLEAHRYRSTLHCMAMIYKKEGLLAFYKGLVPRLVKVSLEVAIAFTVYSAALDLLEKSK